MKYQSTFSTEVCLGKILPSIINRSTRYIMLRATSFEQNSGEFEEGKASMS